MKVCTIFYVPNNFWQMQKHTWLRRRCLSLLYSDGQRGFRDLIDLFDLQIVSWLAAPC